MLGLVETGPVVLEKKMYMYVPLGKGMALQFKKLEYPSPKAVFFCQVLFNWLSRSGEEDENVKCLQTGRQMKVDQFKLT